MEKGIIKNVIDFTEKGNFMRFDTSVKNYLQKITKQKTVTIIETINPLSVLKIKSYKIRDHINLSGFNPLNGPIFIPLNNLYTTKDGILIVGLREGVHPTNKEKRILEKLGVKAYCYNLVQTAIFAASLGLKINAIGSVKPHQ